MELAFEIEKDVFLSLEEVRNFFKRDGGNRLRYLYTHWNGIKHYRCLKDGGLKAHDFASYKRRIWAKRCRFGQRPILMGKTDSWGQCPIEPL